MENRLATLKCKEVVNICDGCRLGYVCDVELDLISGRIIALLLPVDVELAKVCVPRGRRDWP